MPFPGATYRLQLNRAFTLADALAGLDYLDRLGITDLYLSPLFKARPGSQHGYDVVDPETINPEIGSDADFDRLAEAASRRGMRLILDVIPNHMCVADSGNRWWMDVLENGPSSVYARYFDIDWNPPKPDIQGKVLFPVLAEQYGKVLESGGIRVEWSDGCFSVDYSGLNLPLSPKTWRHILEIAAGKIEDPDERAEVDELLKALADLPARDETAPETVERRIESRKAISRRLHALHERPAASRAVEAALVTLNGKPGQPKSFDGLETLLARQAYRLCNWRVAADEVNYRRFFDVAELAALRVEDPVVFAAVHRRVIEWVAAGKLAGIRVDHVDGLSDPLAYLRNLRAACPGAYIVVEKILTGGESLDPSWPVHGTTGYDFLDRLNGLFVDGRAHKAFRRLYGKLAGVTGGFAQLQLQAKKLVMLVSLSSEVSLLAQQLDRISEQHRLSRDFTLENLRFALREVMAGFAVYRTYARPGESPVSAPDRRHIEHAVSDAARRNPATEPSIFGFLRSVLLLEDPDGLGDKDREARREFVRRFQQLTGPVMAKGVEDTTFYRAFPLASLNEVGGDPESFGTPAAELHRFLAERRRLWPDTLNATATHDTKRGEDVRARLNVLSEMPVEWFRAVRRWHGFNAERASELDGSAVPGPNEEYLLYQTLLGSWPAEPMDRAELAAFGARIQDYMVKAQREAKLRTSWIKPDAGYEQALRRFVSALLTAGRGDRFLTDFERVLAPVARAGAMNSLSQVVLKAAAPGVPDFYQGCETWDLRLVDPDNRGPVDLPALSARLATVHSLSAARLLARAADGRVKLLVTSRALALRRSRKRLFERGDYEPVEAHGDKREHLFAFTRSTEGQSVLAAAGRFYLGLGCREGKEPVGRAWGDTELMLRGPSSWRDALTGRVFAARRSGRRWALAASEVFATLPVTLLERTA